MRLHGSRAARAAQDRPGADRCLGQAERCYIHRDWHLGFLPHLGGNADCGPCTELRSLTHRSLTNAELANERMMRAYGVDMTQAEFLEKVTKVPGQLGELYKGIPAHGMQRLALPLKT